MSADATDRPRREHPVIPYTDGRHHAREAAIDANAGAPVPIAGSSRSDPVVGRDGEILRLAAFIDRISNGPAALSLEGEAGIGKSTLWQWTISRARERGWSILTARPVEAETGQSYASLADLLNTIAGEAVAALPEPQRRALEQVLLLRPAAGGERVDARAVSAASAGVIRTTAASGPVLIGIDDVAWLDSASLRVVGSVIRRLGELPIGVLVTRRSSEPEASPLGLEASLGSDRYERLELPALTRGALQQLLHRHLGRTFARPTLTRLHEASAGNPYVALEIARAIGRRALPIRLDEALPVPATVRALVQDRLTGLDEDVRLALLAIAASTSPTPSDVATVIGDRSRAEAALGAAERGGLVVSERGRYRTSHPLVASTVYADADPARRRLVHARLAAGARDAEGRARHLARSVREPDDGVADALESASSEARRRGAPEGAAELLRLAVELTPPGNEALGRRRALLGAALLEIGSSRAATEELDRAIAILPPGPDRASAGLQRAIAAWYAAPDRAAEKHAEAALADAGDDPRLAARIEAFLAVFCVDQPRAVMHAVAAVEGAQAAGVELEPAVRALAVWQRFIGEVALGLKPDEDLAAQGRALGPIDDPTKIPTVPGLWALAVGRFAEARAFFTDVLARAAATGAASSDADLEGHLAEVELWAGDWDAALGRVERARAAAAELEQAPPPSALRVLAAVRSWRGDAAAARAIVGEHLDPSELTRDPLVHAGWLQTATSVELTAGDAAAAHRYASESARTLAGIGVREPLLIDTAADHAEALVSLGDLGGAADWLAGLERRHAVIPRAAHAAAIARIRALLAATPDEADAALANTAPALEADGDWTPYDRLRALHARATLQRRRRDRRGAAESLEAALEIADRLGALPMRERVMEGLDRLGRRRAGSLELTPTELQVAEITASGCTNRQVAARLYMSPKTVEAHLARIYGKLGIASRAELGRAMAARTVHRE